MYALWILGGQLERILNRARFVALYAASLLGVHVLRAQLTSERFSVPRSMNLRSPNSSVSKDWEALP